MLPRNLATSWSPTILVVDDHAEIRSLTAAFLRRRGYQVEEVDSGRAGINIIRQIPVDVLITDLRLPDKREGLQVLAYHHKVSPQRGRILFTAVYSEELRILCRNVNALYLPKPIPLKELLVKVESFLPETKLTPFD